MANPRTPNIGLNKIDRTSPDTTYFDLEKYIDQNADAIDQFAGRVNDAIDHARDRLDTEQRQEVVLNAGMQILNAQRSAAFSLSGIKGRTLVNLLGRDGSCEFLSGLSTPSANAAIDTSIKTSGSSSIKVTSNSNVAFGVYKDTPIDSSKHYIALVDMKNGSTPRSILRISKNDFTMIKDSIA
ncbi:hypothetical protein ACFRAK_29020, partial [Peribacillus sp. NPDC056705]